MREPAPPGRETRYARLAEELATTIRTGRLPPGAALPSLRSLALQRGVSLNTVTAAYRLLEDRGLITARPQSGFYVCSTALTPEAALRRRPARLGLGKAMDVVSELMEVQRSATTLDLALACPRGARFYPQARLRRATAEALRQAEQVGTYALPPGSAALREQIAQRARRLGMALDPDEVLLTHGCAEALQLALRAVALPGDRIGIEGPAYFNLYPLLQALGLVAIEIPTDPRHGVDMRIVERLLADHEVTALVLTPTVQNPLGFTMSLANKQRLARLLSAHRVPLIEDIVYAELQFADPPEPTVKSFDEEGWVIVCSGFSKTLAPDYRLGWMEAGRFSGAVRQLKFAFSGAESQVLSDAVARFLQSGAYEHHLRGLRRLYERQVASVRGLIAAHFPPGTRSTQPAGGFVLWVELPASVDSLALYRAALADGIFILPGQVFSSGSRYRHCIRISCCRDIDARCVEAIRRVGEHARALSTQSSAR